MPFQDYKFTGQRGDATGLVYMNARYYDPAIGQFISQDTIVPDPDNIQDYNRFMYGYGNPVKYADPSGHALQSPTDSDSNPYECATDWCWQNRWYRAHGYLWNGSDWTILGDARFYDEAILNEVTALAGITWANDPYGGSSWTFERKSKVAAGIIGLSHAISGGLGRLNTLLGGYATMQIEDMNPWCSMGTTACTFPWFNHVVSWSPTFVDTMVPSYVTTSAAHELGHIINYLSGGAFSRRYQGMAAMTSYGLDCVGGSFSCSPHAEKWADAVRLAAFPQQTDIPVLVGTREQSLQSDFVKGLLGGWMKP